MKTPIPSNILSPTGGMFRSHNDADDGAAVSVYRFATDGGKLGHLLVTNAGENAAFVQLHDSETEPEEGDVPAIKFALPAGEGVTAALDTPFPFVHGCFAVLSDELATYVPSEETAHFYGLHAER